MRQGSMPVCPLPKMALAINVGGTLFVLAALNPSLKRVSGRSERG